MSSSTPSSRKPPISRCSRANGSSTICRPCTCLEQHFPDIAETQPELLAHHYTEAGLPAQAIPYWQRAGQRAVERSANVEAISHFTKGLELLKTLPETPERTQQELTLQLALGSPLLMLKGPYGPGSGTRLHPGL